MRDIKFRVWLEEIKTVQYSDKLSSFFKDYESTERPLMQYTGLKDKNGVEIYEGDFINTPHVPHPHYVIFTNQRFELKSYGSLSFMKFRSNFGEMEVIGNIYGNPELL